MHIKLLRVVVSPLMFVSLGCVVYRDAPSRGPVVVEAPPPDVQGPVIEGPGVEVVEVEPPPVQRVYVYDVGYPPGCYFYNNYYWYGGYRYQRNVFINRYVTVNIRERRFVNAEENRRRGGQIEQHQRVVYQQTGGRQTARPGQTPGHQGDPRQAPSETRRQGPTPAQPTNPSKKPKPHANQ